jgi:hypothetical protein
MKKHKELLRKQIREILLSIDKTNNTSLSQKKEVPELKKDCYNKLIDLKNEFESVKENPSKDETIEKIDDLVLSLNKIKKALGNQL